MKEIGGYFGLDYFIDNEYYEELIALNTGRNALLYLIRAKNIKKVYIPYYLCSSVSEMLTENKLAFDYYYIDNDFNPIFDMKPDENEFIYIVNYFGQITDERILLYKEKFTNIIVDNTQAFFQKPLAGVDTIYSCRKFFGVPDGAYLSTDSLLNEELEFDSSKDRMAHILGRFEGNASAYYGYFKENDRLFKNESLKYMSNLTRNILRAIDYERIRKSRERNYVYLHKNLNEHNKLNLTTPIGPFAYPFYVEDGISIRKRLAAKKIYIPTLWPNVLTEMPKESVEYKYSSNILPLPCDQRYGIEDMQYLVEEVSKFVGES